MSKYIDADRLIHDLEERIYAYSEGYADGDDYRKDAIETLLKDVKYQCSLQQEQPKRICTRCIYLNKTNDICEYPYGGKSSLINENGVYECNGFEEVEQQEQPSLPDLDEAAEEHINKALFKWSYDDEDGIEQYVYDAFKAGAEWVMQYLKVK